jgi:hypothetical protein
MATWDLTRDESTTEDSLIDVQTTKTANPFGDFAIGYIDDIEGAKFDAYPFGTRVDFAVTPRGGTQQTDFTGFVVERRETDQQGADVLEAEAYSFDQFLRANDVTNDQTGNSISEALEDIITTDTPVTWNASNVSVTDDVQLTQSLKDERVETALQILSFKSANEAFGVNDSLEFFFRERETTHIQRGIDNTEWFDYDLPERGKEAINEVEVRFNGGNESVVVDNPGQKLDLQEGLNLPEPGTQRERINRPEITDPADAEDEGRRYLKFRNATLTGTVTTYGLFDASPFDTIDVEITDRGIDDEFIIVGVEKKWGRDETILTLVENRGFGDDFIVRLAEKTERLDLRDSDPDAAEDRITTTDVGVSLTVDATFGSTQTDREKVVNTGRNLIRDGWRGAGNLDIAEVRIGTDNTNLSRSNTALASQVATASATETLVGDTSVRYEATFTQTGVTEAGVFDSSGNLITRVITDSPVDLSSDTVQIAIAVENDASVPRAVLTDTGQETIRDIIADNSPSLPTQYAYGSGTTDPAETDTSLVTQEYSQDLNDVLLRSVETQSEWETFTPDIASTTPLSISGGLLTTTAICFTQEGEDYQNGKETITTGFDGQNSDYSGGEGAIFGRGPGTNLGADFAEWFFTVRHTIPASDFGVEVRHDEHDADGLPGLVWELEHPNGETYLIDEVSTFGTTNINLGWGNIGDGFFDAGLGYSGPDLPPGDYILRLRITTSDATVDQYGYIVDVVTPHDERYKANLTFDNTNGGSSGYLDGPELYPLEETITFNTIDTRREFDSARVASNWILNEVSNGQEIILANNVDGVDYTTSNSETASVDPFSNPSTELITKATLSRYGSRTSATPQTGYQNQAIDAWDVFANPDAIVPDGIGAANTRAIISRETLTNGDTLTEAGHLDSANTTLTRSVFAAIDITDQIQNLISSETVTFRTG